MTGGRLLMQDWESVSVDVWLTDPQGPFKGCTITKGHDHDRDRTVPRHPHPSASSSKTTESQGTSQPASQR